MSVYSCTLCFLVPYFDPCMYIAGKLVSLPIGRLNLVIKVLVNEMKAFVRAYE